MDALDLREVVLAGLSFGGWIAAEIAIKSTARVSHLVLADAVGIKLGDREHRDIADIFTTRQDEVDRLAYHDPKVGAVDHATISDDDALIMFRNREATALFAWSPPAQNPKTRGGMLLDFFSAPARPWAGGGPATRRVSRLWSRSLAGAVSGRLAAIHRRA
jgi:pimeloyl-ACP methyl ester carboxylesterase